MAQVMGQIALWIEQIIASLGYSGIGIVMFIENLFPPIPSELVMPFAGFLVGRHNLSIVGVWLAGMLGSVIGALVLYGIGRWLGDGPIRAGLHRYGRWVRTSEADYDRALRFFDRYGYRIVFFGRLIPIVRSIISLPAGADHMPLLPFVLFTASGSAIWCGALVFAGMLLGENWREIVNWMEHYQHLTLIILILILLVIGARWVYRRLNWSRTTASTIEYDQQ